MNNKFEALKLLGLHKNSYGVVASNGDYPRVTCGPGGGGLPYETDGDARRLA